jgi:hypothetical protein
MFRMRAAWSLRSGLPPAPGPAPVHPRRGMRAGTVHERLPVRRPRRLRIPLVRVRMPPDADLAAAWAAAIREVMGWQPQEPREDGRLRELARQQVAESRAARPVVLWQRPEQDDHGLSRQQHRQGDQQDQQHPPGHPASHEGSLSSPRLKSSSGAHLWCPMASPPYDPLAVRADLRLPRRIIPPAGPRHPRPLPPV